MGVNVLEKIDKIRISKNWSVYELAEQASIPQSTLSNMFIRKTLPSISTLEKICDAFNISLAEFFIDNDEIEYKLQAIDFMKIFKELPSTSRIALIDFLKTLK